MLLLDCSAAFASIAINLVGKPSYFFTSELPFKQEDDCIPEKGEKSICMADA